MPNARPIAERFHEKYERVPFSGCWLWTGSTMAKGGYGKITVKQGEQKCTGAHRVSWMLHRGEIPAGLWVLHRCDVPACVNPDHLFLGTARDNVVDCVAKGRQGVRPLKVGPFLSRAERKWRAYIRKGRPDQKGEENFGAKLDWEKVADIRTHRLTKAGFSRLYGVSFKAVKNVWDGVSWVDVAEAKN